MLSPKHTFNELVLKITKKKRNRHNSIKKKAKYQDKGLLIYLTRKMEFTETIKFSPTYIRTEKKNLRCFPNCSEFHMEKSFCGRSVKVVLKHNMWEQISNKSMNIFGEFRNVHSSSRKEGDLIDDDHFYDQEDILVSQFSYFSENREPIFVFNPKKWKCSPFSSNICFSIYLVVENRIRLSLNSNGFEVVERGRAKRGLNDNTYPISSPPALIHSPQSPSSFSEEFIPKRVRDSEVVTVDETTSNNNNVVTMMLLLPTEFSLPCLCFDKCTCGEPDFSMSFYCAESSN